MGARNYLKKINPYFVNKTNSQFEIFHTKNSAYDRLQSRQPFGSNTRQNCALNMFLYKNYSFYKTLALASKLLPNVILAKFTPNMYLGWIILKNPQLFQKFIFGQKVP